MVFTPPNFSFYVVSTDVSWANQFSNPIKTVKTVIKNAGASNTVLRNIPAYVGVSEGTYLSDAEHWINRATFYFAILKNSIGAKPTSVDVSLIDYNGKESPVTNFALVEVLDPALLFNATSDTIYDDGDFDRLEADVDGTSDPVQINVYNQNVPANRDHTGNPWLVNDIIFLNSEQVEIDSIDDAANGLYTVNRAQNGTTKVAHSAGTVARR